MHKFDLLFMNIIKDFHNSISTRWLFIKKAENPEKTLGARQEPTTNSTHMRQRWEVRGVGSQRCEARGVE